MWARSRSLAPRGSAPGCPQRRHRRWQLLSVGAEQIERRHQAMAGNEIGFAGDRLLAVGDRIVAQRHQVPQCPVIMGERLGIGGRQWATKQVFRGHENLPAVAPTTTKRTRAIRRNANS